MSKRDYDFQPVQTPLDPKAVDFHANNGLWLAAASNLAYMDEGVIREVVKGWGFDKFSFVEAKDREKGIDTQAFLCSNPEAVLLAFRGTEPKDLKDWLTDVRATPVPGPAGKGKVHRGFLHALSAAWPQLEEALKNHRDNQQTIWVTGHSLGGSLAVLAVARLLFETKTAVQGLYTFGQPRTCDWTFTRVFNQAFPAQANRLVNNNDIVPHLPPIGILWRYWHIERMFYIDASGDLRPSMPIWRWIVEGGKGVIQDIGQLGPDLLNDHDMDRYVGHMRRHALSKS
jgi:triacylglycerol lipase